MYCANCSEKIMGDPLRQGSEYYCSVECANIAQGVDPEDPLVFETKEYDADFLAEEED